LTAAALTVDPFCLGMQEYRLSEGWTREEMTLTADTSKPSGEAKDEEDEPTLEDLLSKLGGIHDKLKEHIKGCKGAPGPSLKWYQNCSATLLSSRIRKRRL